MLGIILKRISSMYNNKSKELGKKYKKRLDNNKQRLKNLYKSANEDVKRVKYKKLARFYKILSGVAIFIEQIFLYIALLLFQGFFVIFIALIVILLVIILVFNNLSDDLVCTCKRATTEQSNSSSSTYIDGSWSSLGMGNLAWAFETGGQVVGSYRIWDRSKLPSESWYNYGAMQTNRGSTIELIKYVMDNSVSLKQALGGSYESALITQSGSPNDPLTDSAKAWWTGEHSDEESKEMEELQRRYSWESYGKVMNDRLKKVYGVDFTRSRYLYEVMLSRSYHRGAYWTWCGDGRVKLEGTKYLNINSSMTDDEIVDAIYDYEERTITNSGNRFSPTKQLERKAAEQFKGQPMPSEFTTGLPSGVLDETPVINTNTSGNKILETAKKYLGVPYLWGGTSPSGFDCSGLVQYVCAEVGISVPRVAASQATVGVSVDKDDLQPGDLVFFKKGGAEIHHVGIYAGDGNYLHAPSSGDVVKIAPMTRSDYYCARRLTVSEGTEISGSTNNSQTYTKPEGVVFYGDSWMDNSTFKGEFGAGNTLRVKGSMWAQYFVENNLVTEQAGTKAVFVQFGLNDWQTGETGLTDSSYMKQFLDKLGEVHKGVPILITRSPHTGSGYVTQYGSDINPRCDKYSEYVKQYCESHDNFKYVDVTSCLEDSNGWLKPEYVDSSTFHLTQEGYKVWFEAINKELLGVLNDSTSSSSSGVSNSLGLEGIIEIDPNCPIHGKLLKQDTNSSSSSNFTVGSFTEEVGKFQGPWGDLTEYVNQLPTAQREVCMNLLPHVGKKPINFGTELYNNYKIDKWKSINGVGFVRYSQTSSQAKIEEYAYLPYRLNNNSTIGKAGCGGYATAAVLSTYLGKYINVAEVTIAFYTHCLKTGEDLYNKYGYQQSSVFYVKDIAKVLTHYGFITKEGGAYQDKQQTIDCLNNNGMVIYVVQGNANSFGGMHTGGGHYIVIREYLPDKDRFLCYSSTRFSDEVSNYEATWEEVSGACPASMMQWILVNPSENMQVGIKAS